VQEKAIAHLTDARLTHRAIEKLVGLAKSEGVELRQSYLRVAKRAAIMVGRYTHAHQFKRARRELKFLRTRLRRIIRDLRRKIDGNTVLEDRFDPLLDLALRVRHQQQHQRGQKVYSLHASEVECIGRGKARARYEFGCKVSIATPVTAPKGGQFVLHAKALHGNPTAIPSVPSSPISKSSRVSRSAASTATRAIAVTTIRTGSRSGSPARSGV
jgi:IS5 family transposase